MQMLLAVFTAVHLRKKVEDPSEHPSHFMPMVRTTPTALEMLPDEEITSAPETASTGS